MIRNNLPSNRRNNHWRPIASDLWWSGTHLSSDKGR